MPHTQDRAASRFGRDRDLLPDRPALGPYETPYDVRRGYQQPLRRTLRRADEEPTRFRGRDEVEVSTTDRGDE